MEVSLITELFFKYKSWILTGGSVVILFVIIFLFFKNDDSIEMITEPMSSSDFVANATEKKTEVAEEIEPLKTVFVEIKGAVYNPGVYELPSDGRVKNVIELARLMDNCDLKTINQAEKLKDEMVIYIPKVGEEIEEKVVVSSYESEENNLVNVNTAGISELTTLNGIGEKKAQAILDYREENGLFMKVEDLLNIPGIGEKTLENLKPYISIGD